jgi:DNA processing protein
LDRLHPTGNTDLFARVTENGLLISVWPPGTLTSRTRFLANFRLLAALSAGTVLVEASLASGTLTALREAIRLGRPAMVMPGPVTSAQSAGCHEALRRYPDVRLVTDAADVLAELDTPASAPAQIHIPAGGAVTATAPPAAHSEGEPHARRSTVPRASRRGQSPQALHRRGRAGL